MRTVIIDLNFINQKIKILKQNYIKIVSRFLLQNKCVFIIAIAIIRNHDSLLFLFSRSPVFIF